MVFIRYKFVSGIYYAYQCVSIWNSEKKSPRQKVIKYLGKVKTLDKIPHEFLNKFYNEENKCNICTESNKELLSIDHIIPLSKGGTNDITNLQILCIKCNQNKGSKII